MDAIRHRAICLNLATHIESLGNGHSVVFHSTVGAHTHTHTYTDKHAHTRTHSLPKSKLKQRWNNMCNKAPLNKECALREHYTEYLVCFISVPPCHVSDWHVYLCVCVWYMSGCWVYELGFLLTSPTLQSTIIIKSVCVCFQPLASELVGCSLYVCAYIFLL